MHQLASLLMIMSNSCIPTFLHLLSQNYCPHDTDKIIHWVELYACLKSFEVRSMFNRKSTIAVYIFGRWVLSRDGLGHQGPSGEQSKFSECCRLCNRTAWWAWGPSFTKRMTHQEIYRLTSEWASPSLVLGNLCVSTFLNNLDPRAISLWQLSYLLVLFLPHVFKKFSSPFY